MIRRHFLPYLAGLVFLTVPVRAETASASSNAIEGAKTLAEAAAKLHDLVNAPGNERGAAIALDLRFPQAEGQTKALAGKSVSIVFQAPDRVKFTTSLEGHELTIGRNGDTMWIYDPGHKFGLDGSNAVPRFAADPTSLAEVHLDPLRIPIEKNQIALLPAIFQIDASKGKTDQGEDTLTIKASATDNARDALNLPFGKLSVSLETPSLRPLKIGYSSGGDEVIAEVEHAEVLDPAPDDAFWKIPAKPDDRIEKVALAHLQRFTWNAFNQLTQKIPTLGTPTGEKKLVATEGKGRLEIHDGTRVLFLQGNPEEMGRQQGILLGNEVREVTGRILYGVGVGSSFADGEWFFGKIEKAQARLEKFMDPRYLREMDALSAAAGMHPQEGRLSNFFPELFHCSGFALYGSAVADGQMYHGRVLDYLKGMGLEQNAVVSIIKPDQGNAWVNCSYAGFIGSITAMNEKHVAIGEMGGRGEGRWDGKPMAQIMRECMEKADTVDQALDIMRKSPRTCEYYYVISDAKSMKACGVKATPEAVEVIWSGEGHPQLPEPVKDTVLMSAGDRYEELVKRVKANNGKFTADTARDLMTRPVCMNSNIQSVLFAPKSLDFWVANADGKNVASHTRYTRYNLRELLDSMDPKKISAK